MSIWGVHQPKKGCLTNMNTLLNNFWCNCLQEIHANLLGVHWVVQVGSSAKFGVVVFKVSILNSQGVGSISQSRFVCQDGCTGIQSISAQLPRGSICQSMFICQVLCTGIQGIYALLMGSPWAKEGSSDKYEHTSKLLLNIFQHNCLQEIHSHFWGVGGPLANIGSSANFGVLVFKAFMLY